MAKFHHRRGTLDRYSISIVQRTHLTIPPLIIQSLSGDIWDKTNGVPQEEYLAFFDCMDALLRSNLFNTKDQNYLANLGIIFSLLERDRITTPTKEYPTDSILKYFLSTNLALTVPAKDKDDYKSQVTERVSQHFPRIELPQAAAAACAANANISSDLESRFHAAFAAIGIPEGYDNISPNLLAMLDNNEEQIEILLSDTELMGKFQKYVNAEITDFNKLEYEALDPNLQASYLTDFYLAHYSLDKFHSWLKQEDDILNQKFERLTSWAQAEDIVAVPTYSMPAKMESTEQDAEPKSVEVTSGIFDTANDDGLTRRKYALEKRAEVETLLKEAIIKIARETPLLIEPHKITVSLLPADAQIMGVTISNTYNILELKNILDFRPPQAPGAKSKQPTKFGSIAREIIDSMITRPRTASTTQLDHAEQKPLRPLTLGGDVRY